MPAMTRDYAKRTPSARQTRRNRSVRGKGPSRGKTGSRGATAQSVWSAPSFSAGALFGAALVLLAGYAPSVFRDNATVLEAPVSQPEPIQFDFEEILTSGTVQADTSAYPARFPEEDPEATQPAYLVQAVSVRSEENAQALCAELNELELECRWQRADLTSGTWYRVLVGPFRSRRDADRAMMVLRERNMTPRLSKPG